MHSAHCNLVLVINSRRCFVAWDNTCFMTKSVCGACTAVSEILQQVFEALIVGQVRKMSSPVTCLDFVTVANGSGHGYEESS